MMCEAMATTPAEAHSEASATLLAVSRAAWQADAQYCIV